MHYETLSADIEKELEKKIEDYFRQYPSAGYGTFVKSRWEAEGKFFAQITRGLNCD